MPADFVIEHAGVVATCAGPAPRRGPAQREISTLSDAVVAARDGQIVFVGPAAALDAHLTVLPGAVRIDARGGTVVPGFVDPHTHVVYAGDRLQEVRRRLAGATYAEIAAAGGGILRTVADTRRASEDDLVTTASARLDEMAACGTTTCEVKSGYGLTTDAELRLLRAIRRLDAGHPLDLVPTFLGAHEIPKEFRSNPEAFVALVTGEMIPAVAAESLAEWCDVFCESGAFTPAQSLAILEAGRRHGLKPRIHADELGASGGWRVAVEAGARSADHLVFVDAEGARALAGAGVCAVLLPAASLYLKLGRYAPARLLIDTGVPVALGTDINPGAGFSPSMPFAMTLACFAMDMTLEEALIAATLNAAWALDRADAVGSLERGKRMDAVIVEGDAINLVRAGARAIRAVIKNGKVIVQ
ncbi:MAG: imidazolonepropionase [Acidobacteria bacterium RIFCSPLOWO2_12_FULL_67_14]|nr:MAG: imidazolonepropionase [Acidobacteria bacterium RIFCSPLOWO2_02_FULL_67_21]OFW37890.1 MAG: imidazolonepropionase [Acidobacteria bacterium RIFCSPLOWO2_12_FULL_67_14]